MNPIAAILNSGIFYRYSLILALAAGAGICFFMACCSHVKIPAHRAAAAALVAVVFSLPLSRLVYWYGRPDNFPSLLAALTTSSTESFALTGAFAGCALAVIVSCRAEERKKMLDCMSIAGCASMALGRLGCFFTDTDRGQIMTRLTSLPWAHPVANTSGQLDYRFATFLFQAGTVAALGIFLALLFFRKKQKPGDLFILFLMIYSASQVLLDSTRYDSLYLRSNGFISIVQVLSVLSLVIVVVHLSICAVKALGWKKWMFPLWIVLVALFGGVGYMEYFVQRHGQEAAIAYSAMGIYLTAIVTIGLLLWYWPQASETEK